MKILPIPEKGAKPQFLNSKKVIFMSKYLLALDQGTTSSRALVIDYSGKVISVAQKEFTQFFPEPGQVEHDANEIWASQIGVAADAIGRADISHKDIAAIGITNQRETVVIWDRKSGEPINNAIVWQDRRTAPFCDKMRADGLQPLIQKKTGLVIDAYFSGTKVRWLLDNVPGAREKADRGELAFGTMDSWLIWKLTKGQVHVTDETNASRTMLFNIHTRDWDDELLSVLNVPRSVLPTAKSSSEVYGTTAVGTLEGLPIAGIAGDQQAALFGQMCSKPGMAKNTYGTGCFMLMNTGTEAVPSKNNLLTTIAWRKNNTTEYALEGSIFVAGAVVQWLRDGLGHHQDGTRGGSFGGQRTGHRRRLFGAGFCRPRSSALGCLCPRRHPRIDPWKYLRPHCSSGSGRNRVSSR